MAAGTPAIITTFQIEYGGRESKCSMPDESAPLKELSEKPPPNDFQIYLTGLKYDIWLPFAMKTGK